MLLSTYLTLWFFLVWLCKFLTPRASQRGNKEESVHFKIPNSHSKESLQMFPFQRNGVHNLPPTSLSLLSMSIITKFLICKSCRRTDGAHKCINICMISTGVTQQWRHMQFFSTLFVLQYTNHIENCNISVLLLAVSRKLSPLFLQEMPIILNMLRKSHLSVDMLHTAFGRQFRLQFQL